MAAAAQTKNDAERAAGGDQPAVAGDQKPGRRREQSSISFPYVSLDDVEEGARAIFGKAGTAEIDVVQAANAMGQSPTGSTFRGRIAGMKLFGLVDTDQGRARLTALGRAISEEHSTAAARIEAFLRIPLYERIKANHHGRTLPKAPAFEHELIEAGVVSKQATRARQVFERSAKHAGFLEPGSDKFVEPILERRQEQFSTNNRSARDKAADTASSTPAGRPGSAGGSGGGPGNEAANHPFVKGLLTALPPPGTSWLVQARIKWLRTAAGVFDLMYEGDASIKVEEDNNGS